MIKYYTRACNFYFGPISKEKVKKNLALPLNGNKLISFDTIEIFSRKNTKRVNLKQIKKLKIVLKKNFNRFKTNYKKKIFKGLKFSNITYFNGSTKLNSR